MLELELKNGEWLIISLQEEIIDNYKITRTTNVFVIIESINDYISGLDDCLYDYITNMEKTVILREILKMNSN